MKKSILVFSHVMEIGGAERALLGLLESIDYTRYEVDLFLMRHSGELMQYIPAQVNLLPEVPQYASLAIPIGEVLRKRQFGVACGRFIGKENAKKRIRELKLPADNGVQLEYSHKYTRRWMSKISEKTYDLAISFLTPHYFVAEKVNAKRKAAWIHTDYTAVRVDVESELAMWNRYDHIISISESVTESFLKVFPSLSDKIRLIHNMLPQKSILKQADEFTVQNEMPEDGSIRLLSIGRFCRAKNYDNVPDICRRLLDAGVNVTWYIIGYGGSEQLIRDKIVEAGMQDHVVILGKKDNPYPYIKACNVYVQPSRYEGNSVTVHEAQMLGKPVIITKYLTASNQLQDGVDGVIVPIENGACAEKMARILQNREVLARMHENCLHRDYSNQAEVIKIDELFCR